MSKTLVLVRHGEAEAATPGGDLERRLTGAGAATASAVGATLLRLGYRPDAVLCSSATRAKETAERLAQGQAIESVGRLYLGDTDAYAACLGELDDRHGTAFLVAHNPTLSVLAQALGRIRIALSPGDWVCFELAIDSWADFAKDSPARRLGGSR
jgi:phosphohistidine phosphatase